MGKKKEGGVVFIAVKEGASEKFFWKFVNEVLKPLESELMSEEQIKEKIRKVVREDVWVLLMKEV